MQHIYNGEVLDFHLVYKKQKNLSIQFDVYGGVEIIAPKGTKEEVIIKVIETNWTRILDKKKELQLRQNGTMEKAYDDGEKFLYLGKEYPIIMVQDRDLEKNRVEFKDNQLVIYVKDDNEDKVKQALKRFYYKKCKALVEGRVNFYQHHFKDKPREITIKDDTSNWGTCNSRREITFNWRLAMAPMEVIDYVVVHEMCHMVHMNHDRSFWRLVGKIMPDYENKQHWLAVSNWKMTV